MINVINVDIIVEAINHFVSSHSKVDLGCGLAAFSCKHVRLHLTGGF